MIFNRFTAAMLVLVTVTLEAQAEVRIGRNNGGGINDYLQWASAVNATGEQVVIAGGCASACTLITGFVPRKRICVTPEGFLAFHQSFLGYTNEVTGRLESLGPSTSGTKKLWRNYPRYVRTWLKKKGGLTDKLLVLKGKELEQMFRTCS